MNNNSDSDQNIKVIIRIKGKTPEDEGQKSTLIKVKNGKSISISTNSTKKDFDYDYVGNQNSTQNNIFEQCGKRICDYSLEGYNATIFAYGQTGSGKTYTLLGKSILNYEENQNINSRNSINSSEDLEMEDSYQNNNNEYNYFINDENIGLLPRILYYLFEKSNSMKNEENEFIFKISYLEIYNERIKDLLHLDNTKKVEISDINGVVNLKNLRKLKISSPGEAIKYIINGNQFRHTASTLMNKESSRSHAIISIYIENKLIKENKLKKSVFHIIDLAGSENQRRTGATGERTREAGSINKSLLNLSIVIRNIINKKRQIPYRDSKLTHILRDSLGGNAKTSIIATISNLDSNIEETKNTLDFAQNAKKIINNAIVNEELSSNDAKILKEKLKNLQNNYNSIFRECNNLRLELQNRRNSINANDNISESFEFQNEDINKLMSDILEKEENLKELKNENDNLKDKIEKDDIEFKLKDEENKLILEENKDLKDKIKLLEEKLNQNEAKIKTMEESYKNELLQKEENYKILHAQKSDNDEIISKLKEKINVYEEKINLINEEFNKRNNLLEEKNNKIKEMELIINQEKNKYEELNNNIKNFIEEINKYKNELIEKTKENIEIKSKGKDILSKFEENTIKLKEEIKKKDDEVKELKDENKKLNDTLKELKDIYLEYDKQMNNVNRLMEAREEEKKMFNIKLENDRKSISFYLDTICILQQDKINFENEKELLLEEKEKAEKNLIHLYDISGKQPNNSNVNNNINNREFIQLKKENEKLKKNYENLIKNIEPKNENGTSKVKKIQDLVDKLNNYEEELNDYKNAIKNNIKIIGEHININANDFRGKTTLKNKLNLVIQLIVDNFTKKNVEIQQLNDEKELLLKNISINNLKQNLVEILNSKNNLNRSQGNINRFSTINKLRTKESVISRKSFGENKSNELIKDINFSFNKENESRNSN